MSRPGFVLDVDRSTPPILFWRGERFTTEKLPHGTRVLYPPEPIKGLNDVSGGITKALDNPLQSEPLRALLNAGMKLTLAIAVETATPGVSQHGACRRITEAVLNIAAEERVEDVAIVMARGLSRRFQDNELRTLLGDRVYDSFTPKGRLTQHDAEDGESLVAVGEVDVNKRAAESDLLITINIGDTGDVISGLLGINAARQQQTTAGLHDKRFHIAATFNNAFVAPTFGFLNKRETEWNPLDKAAFRATRAAFDAAPPIVNRRLLQRLKSPRTITGIFAGSVDPVTEQATQRTQDQRAMHAEGTSDVLAVGVPYFSRYNRDSILNPVLAAASGLQHATSLVREGGAVIMHHPMRNEFDTVQHPSYIDFFNEVLSTSTDAQVIADKYEDRFANDPWYRQLYRTSHAYHGVHPFLVWKQCSVAVKHLGGVIVVGGDIESVRRLGFKPASTFQDALEMARDITGVRDPSLTHAHTPPDVAVDVR